MNLAELEGLAASENVWARADAAKDLGRMGSAAVPLLSRLLSDADPMVRFRAVTSLGDIGRDALVALPALDELLQDESSHVQTETRRVIVTILEAQDQDAQAVVKHTVREGSSLDFASIWWDLFGVEHTGQLYLVLQSRDERGLPEERDPPRLWTFKEAEALVPDRVPRAVWEKALGMVRGT
jgi:HEAT repeat protein